MNKQEKLDWTAGGGNETVLGNLEVLHDTDEVAVTRRSASSTMAANGLVMCLDTKRDGKSPHCWVVRQELLMCMKCAQTFHRMPTRGTR